MRLPAITPQIKYNQVLKTTTLRGFSGGLNVLDDDMNLEYKYATRSVNVAADTDGTMRVRYGTRLFSAVPQPIINMEYFNGSLIVVCANGTIYAVFADSTSSLLWSAWGATDFASFAQFDGQMIVCNGLNKPVTISNLFVATYLQDLATLTNINVPVCKYVVTNGRYLVMAGDPLFPERVHISCRDAPGTWYGDPPPNDAVRQDVGSILANATTLRGLLSFRDKLLVLYAEGIIVGTLGIYGIVPPATVSTHNPTFNDAIDKFGCVAHRAAVARGDDGLFMDLQGVPSIKRSVLNTSLKPERASAFIDPAITRWVATLNFLTLSDRVFAVYDSKEGKYLLCIPNSNTLAATTETPIFVYSYRPSLRQDSWAEFRGWNFTCGATSLQGNIFFGDRIGNIWVYGTRDNPTYKDFIDDYHSVGANPGVPIVFDWETPWLDMGARAAIKNNKFISMDTRGPAVFTMSMYVDNITSAPQLQMTLSGGEQGPFVNPPGGAVSVMARPTSYKKQIAWPTKYTIAKLRAQGSTTTALSFVAITMHYLQGGINR